MTQAGIGRRGFWDSFWLPALVLVLTVAQLAVAEWVPGIERFADKAFGARLIAYWVFLCLGLGLVLVPRLRPAWILVGLVTGFGCVLALGWEFGEWYTFIRHGTELDTAYEDTLGDMALGTVGSVVAGFLLLRLGRRA